MNIIDEKWINETWEKIDKKLSKVAVRAREMLPYTTVDGKFTDMMEIALDLA